jgi:ribosome-binding factor A
MSHRSRRVADQVREELARLLREELRDPRVGFVTLTGVDLSPDLRQARVHVSILQADPEEALGALAKAAPFLRRGLARHAGLRFTPQLRFVEDRSARTGSRVESLLRDLGRGEPADPPEDEESEESEEPPGTSDR